MAFASSSSSSIADQSARTEQRKLERLFALIFMVGGATSSIGSLFDSSSGLFTRWDDYGTSITSVLYFVSGLLIYLRPKWLVGAVVISMLPTAIYQQGVMAVAVHQPSIASLYSAAASGPFFPLLYVVLFITLPRGAATLSWINCAGFYIQFLLNATWLSEPFPSPDRLEAEHFLVEVMMAHPIYIVALSYIVKLRERLHTTQQDAFKVKEGFIGILSHEIRNQLQTMVGAIELLDLKLSDPAERRSVNRLQCATMQLQTYLCDINELTMLEDPTLRVETSRFDLTALLDDLRDEWLPQSQYRGLLLIVDTPRVDGQGFLIDSDKVRLRQIISNLVSNALKYTDRGSVMITASISEKSPGCVTVEVSDTGVGIEEKFLKRIFLPHVRLENSLSPSTTGSGLGLTIVERLVTSLGGTLRVDSRIGHGSTFGVTLPGLAKR